MPSDFQQRCQADRRHTLWSGDLAVLGSAYPTEFEEPTLSVVDGVASVTTPAIVTATGWHRVGDLVGEAARQPGVRSIIIRINTKATQVRGLAKCCDEIRRLASSVSIVGVAESAVGGGCVLLQACSRRYAATPQSRVGTGAEGKPFVNAESN